MKKLYLILGVLVLCSSLVLAVGYGYTHLNGSKVFFDDEGKISGIEDTAKQQSRLPTLQERLENKYIPQTFAQCLTSKGAVFYGQEWCPHCQNQKKEFGLDFKDINYVVCDENPDICNTMKVTSVPDWRINGEQYLGYKTKEELSEISGCVLS